MRLLSSRPSIFLPFQVRPLYVGAPLIRNASSLIATVVFRVGAPSGHATAGQRRSIEVSVRRIAVMIALLRGPCPFAADSILGRAALPGGSPHEAGPLTGRRGGARVPRGDRAAVADVARRGRSRWMPPTRTEGVT